MDRNDLIKIVDEHIALFPNATERLAAIITASLNTLKNERLVSVEPHYIVEILSKEVFKRASFSAKHNAAKTMKHFLANPEGNNVNMPHLAKIHAMSRSSHFKTLVKHGLIYPVKKGCYHLSLKGIYVLEKAYDLKQEALASSQL
jgi:hypothetical protein